MNEAHTKALARADKLGVKILGRGRWTSGQAFFLVSSATGSKPHIVTTDGPHEECDCPARTLCMHRAVVRRQLAADAQATAEHLERIRASMEQEREAMQALQEATRELATANAAAKRDTAMLASRASNTPFSIFKTA